MRARIGLVTLVAAVVVGPGAHRSALTSSRPPDVADPYVPPAPQPFDYSAFFRIDDMLLDRDRLDVREGLIDPLGPHRRRGSVLQAWDFGRRGIEDYLDETTNPGIWISFGAAPEDVIVIVVPVYVSSV